jgi:hypothetical protein
LVLLPADWPKPYAGAFLIARFGNYIDIEKDVGYDLLLATLDDSTTPMRISTRTLAGPLGRPLDVEMLDGKAYVLEFCRETDNQHTRLGLPGRVLELAVKK